MTIARLWKHKELDSDPIQFSKQNLPGNWKMQPIQLLLVNLFALTNLEKNQRNKITILPRKFNSLIKDGKLWRSKCYTNTNTPLNKLKSTTKNKHVTSLYIFLLLFLTFSKESFIWNKKNSSYLPHTRNHRNKMIKFPQ